MPISIMHSCYPIKTTALTSIGGKTLIKSPKHKASSPTTLALVIVGIVWVFLNDIGTVGGRWQNRGTIRNILFPAPLRDKSLILEMFRDIHLLIFY